MNRTKGFTLIELMIVVVIIGILATCAIPAYQHYIVRARVTEGLSLATSAKLTVSEYLLAHNGQISPQMGEGYLSPAATDNVSSIVINKETGDVVISYTSAAGDGTIILHPELQTTGQISWTCNEGTLDAVYRPAECKGS